MAVSAIRAFKRRNNIKIMTDKKVTIEVNQDRTGERRTTTEEAVANSKRNHLYNLKEAASAEV